MALYSKRRTFIFSSISGSLLATLFGLDQLIRPAKRPENQDQAKLIFDGSHIMTMVFTNELSPMTCDFPKDAQAWYNRDLYLKLCNDCEVKKITTEMADKSYTVHVHFKNAASMARFALTSKRWGVYNSQLRRDAGISVHVTYRV